jgi:hypothetical protein
MSAAPKPEFEHVQNVFSPRQSRYIKISTELLEHLQKKFDEAHSKGYDFNIQVCDFSSSSLSPSPSRQKRRGTGQTSEGRGVTPDEG